MKDRLREMEAKPRKGSSEGENPVLAKTLALPQPESVQKIKTRYATLGFSDKANLDEGNMWPTAYALKELTEVEETRMEGLIKKAAM